MLWLIYVAGFVFGSLLEYWGHRAMHSGWILARVHAEHHASGQAKGVLPEFVQYLLGTSPLLLWGFLISTAAGVSFLAGAACFALFSAYGHQLQHDNPQACFWMRRMPVHAVHHRDRMRDANFGLSVSWWDHVFGTYRVVPWAISAQRPAWRELLNIRWW